MCTLAKAQACCSAPEHVPRGQPHLYACDAVVAEVELLQRGTRAEAQHARQPVALQRELPQPHQPAPPLQPSALGAGKLVAPWLRTLMSTLLAQTQTETASCSPAPHGPHAAPHSTWHGL